jgi:hypothetical protein
MALNWTAGKQGARIAKHQRGDYSVYPEGERYLILLDDALIGYSTSEEIAHDMAEEHAEFGFWGFPPRRRKS